MDKQLVELEVIDLANSGQAVAHQDGKVVFLKGGLPGEKVLAEITRQKRRYNEGIVREIISKSSERIPARCPHFGICGGCAWQDLNYDRQLHYKQKMVQDCLSRIGNLENVRIAEIVGSKDIYYYRNKMEFSFNVTESGFTLGLHRRGHYDEIFDVDDCYLQSELSNRIVKWFREYVARENIPVYDVQNHNGYLRFIVIRQAKNTEDLMVNVVTNYGDFPDKEKFILELTTAFPEITTILHNQNGQKSNIAVGEIEQILFGPEYLEEKIMDKFFRIKANAFFQTNSRQTEVLYRTAFEKLMPIPEDNVLDLYCGAGTIGILLANRVNKVVGVELVEDSVLAARENALINKVENIEFYAGDVKNYLKEHEKDDSFFETVIVDPPRAGLNPKALRRLLRLSPDKVLYISCNPATFARDASELVKAGYSLPEVTPVDMFPHTMHIEVIGCFKRQ